MLSSSEYHFFLNQNATLTNKIKPGTSTKEPITPANTCPLLIPKMPMATATANSELFKITRGINSYDALRGQSKETIENRAYHVYSDE